MGTPYISHESQVSGHSGAIWGDCPFLEILNDPSVGYYWFDDFISDCATATTVANEHGYPVYEGDCTITSSSGAGGALALFGTTDNEEAALQVGGVNSSIFVIPAASSTGKKLWFECRIKKSAITNSLGGFFVGLVGENAAAADFIADAGADFADVDLLGFWGDETDDSLGSHVHVVTQKTGAAFDTIIDTVATLEADTYVKLGFVYDPKAPSHKRIKFFVDGVEQSTYVGETTSDATVYITDTTNFPGGEEMSPMIAIKMAGAADMTVSMDWWKCVQLR
jgi:hypothetical protein